jgi:acyl-coenzyme A thioesterase PaaI-like protein
MSVELITKITEYFETGGAQFARDLDLTITAAEPGSVRFVLPVPPSLTHVGGVLCGQAIMACMDTGMVFVMASLCDGEIRPFTTVQLQTSFERGVPADVGEVSFRAAAARTGRTLVFGEIDLLLPDGRRAAHATTTYMWL